MERNPEVVSLMADLAKPFPEDTIRWKPGAVTGNRAMALAYIDARIVQERLDDTVGPENWQSKFTMLENGAVACELSIRIAGEWITKSDVGGESEQADQGDRTKAAFSDSLKRAAVQFGIGRYLYHLPKQWVDWDAGKKCFRQMPRLSDSGGGYPPPARASRASPGAGKSPQAGKTPTGNQKHFPGASDTKANTQAESKANTQGRVNEANTQSSPGPRVDQNQVDYIDILLGKLGKDAKWTSSSLQERFGKDQLVQLTVAEADKVIKGLEAACRKAGIQVDKVTRPANTASGSNSTAVSAGKTPARRGRF